MLEPATKGALTAARIVALALIAVAALGLAYLHFAPAAVRSRCRKGAHAGELILHPCSYGTEAGSYAADCGTLVVPENRHDAHSRLIAMPVTRIKARSAHPRSRSSASRAAPASRTWSFAKASRFAGNATSSSSATAASTARRVLDCPEVASALRHPRDLLGERSFRRLRRRLPGLRRPAHAGRRRPGRLHAVRSGRRSRGSARRARLRAHRSAQRERRHAHGADLRLALPEEHPPVGDARRQPARPLPLVPARTPRELAQRYAALVCERRQLQCADGRPRRVAAARLRGHARTAGGFLPDQAQQRADRVVLRTHGDDATEARSARPAR